MALTTVTRRSSGGAEENVLDAPASYDAKTKTVSIAGRHIAVGGPVPKLRDSEKFVSYTTSICPYCTRLLPAVIYEKDGSIYIRKVCPTHGTIDELYFSDARQFYRFMSLEEEGVGVTPHVKLAAPCPFNCGLCPRHKNHTALANLVVTNRCDLSCWYCFFYAEKMGYVYEPTLEQIREMIRQYKKEGVTMSVQITGGEPTLRPDLVEIIKLLKEEGVTHIQLNTHGITFARLWFEKGIDAAVSYARALREAGLNTIYMSFDGVTPRANPKNHWEVPYTLEVFRKAGMTSVVLVPTVIKTINDNELGAIIKFAAKHMDVIRGVNFQPVSLTGRMRKEERRRYRVTIPDVLKWVEEQTDGQIPADSWFPIPVAAKVAYFLEAMSGELKVCMGNHPACGSATYVFVERGNDGLPKRFIPITEFFDVEGFVEYIDEKTAELRKEEFTSTSKFKRTIRLAAIVKDISRFVDRERIPKDLNITKLLVNVFVKRNYDALGELHYRMLFLGNMHFMDQYNYDVERVMRCNIHYLTPDGRVIPFCTYNVLNDIYRDYVLRKYQISLEEYAKIHGEDSIGPAVKYVRNIKLLKSSPIYYEAYKGIVPDDILYGRKKE
ncbi:Fe-S osidoreductase [Pyrodictium delaneyi]|uniref:Fe-S osidoreductase n=1 Tax=Pyrodictium delaneyi TaxID=1273541 RepID=A0A0N7JD40_9CREN|nr:radical SAM protein [Pyrodictium delaneyi]ALL01129.1 Fe-S osidoreductase [Pyrodictium delaneyi]OWJ55293.1 radical SAM protein [Pyrodictium delaneyi]